MTEAGLSAAGLTEGGFDDSAEARAGFSETAFGAALAGAGALTGGSASSFDSGAEAEAVGDLAGDSTGFALPLTSDIEPPASRKASCRSSAACFITVRSSGAGISASDLVSGKNDAAGFSGAAAVGAAVRLAGFIAPKPIIVDLRGLGGLAPSVDAAVLVEVAAEPAAAGAGTLPPSPPPAS